VSVEEDNKYEELLNSMISGELADIVLVKKPEMEEW
jgi:hypothetical protein